MWFARWRAPELVPELEHFLGHERGHRASFGGELARRNRSRCRSYLWCGFGGLVLGSVTGLAGRHAIAATTVAIERVVIRHMHEQVVGLTGLDDDAVIIISQIIVEEQEHHDLSAARLVAGGIWSKIIHPVVGASTSVVIWMGMRL